MHDGIILEIDTTDSRSIRVALLRGIERFERSVDMPQSRAQAILPLISDLVTESGIPIGSVSSIRVASGPGSFTGLRVGFAVANMLGVLLGIPVNGSTGISVPTYSD